MHLLWIYVFGFMGLLALAVLFVPVAKRLNFPYTVFASRGRLRIGIYGNCIRAGNHFCAFR